MASWLVTGVRYIPYARIGWHVARWRRGCSEGRFEGFALEGGEVGAAAGGEVEERVELLAVEGLGLGGALDFDEASVAGADDVHVGLGTHVLLVAQVEERGAVDDADGDGGDGAGERFAAGLDELLALCPGDGVGEGDVRAGDGGGAGAAVGLEDVAVEDDGVLAECLVVDDGAQGAADEAGDLVGAAPILPRTDSRSPRVLVERGSMEYSAVTQPSPLPLRQRGRPR